MKERERHTTLQFFHLEKGVRERQREGHATLQFFTPHMETEKGRGGKREREREREGRAREREARHFAKFLFLLQKGKGDGEQRLCEKVRERERETPACKKMFYPGQHFSAAEELSLACTEKPWTEARLPPTVSLGESFLASPQL